MALLLFLKIIYVLFFVDDVSKQIYPKMSKTNYPKFGKFLKCMIMLFSMDRAVLGLSDAVFHTVRCSHRERALCGPAGSSAASALPNGALEEPNGCLDCTVLGRGKDGTVGGSVGKALGCSGGSTRRTMCRRTDARTEGRSATE